MKNKRFFAGIISILLVFGFIGFGCSQPVNGNTSDETENITLTTNGQWGWQAIYNSDSLLNGGKITQGEVYTLTYSFKSNVPMDYLQVVLIDNGNSNGNYRWIELSDYKKVKENIPANSVISGTLTITATGTATDTTAFSNRLVLQAGTGTKTQPTLTFTTLSLKRQMAEVLY